MTGIRTPDLYTATDFDQVLVTQNGQTRMLPKDRMATIFTPKQGPSYTTRAQLYADLAWTAETIGSVFGDANAAYNGSYKKTGNSGAGSWSRIGDLQMSTLTTAQLAAKADAAALTPPPWSSRVGAELPASALQPPEPRFNGVFTGASGTGEQGRVEVQLVPGPGSVPSARYALRHRLAGASTWSTVHFPVADGGYDLVTYLNGTAIELQAAALSSSGVIGPWTPVLPLTVGSGDQALPAGLDADAITISALPGGARVDFATGDDAATVAVRIYRSASPVLDREADAAGALIAVQPSRRSRGGVLCKPELTRYGRLVVEQTTLR